MEKIYQKEDWLRKRYIEDKRSLAQICKECEISSGNLLWFMDKFHISRRSVSEGRHLIAGHHCNLSQEAKEWIDGELLGDGNIYSRSRYSANYHYGSKYREYIDYISTTLNKFGIKQGGKIGVYYHKKFNCYSYSYTSLSYAELLPIYKKWYPKGKKIVPKDIELTPLTCRQWYIGDGSISKEEKYYIKSRIIITTQGFTRSDVEWLVKQLNQLGFKSTHTKDNSIYIWVRSTKDFLNYIGKCPVNCYQYKWNC